MLIEIFIQTLLCINLVLIFHFLKRLYYIYFQDNFFQKLLLNEFIECENMDKFDESKEVRFKNGTLMYDWFKKNEDVKELSPPKDGSWLNENINESLTESEEIIYFFS